MLSKAKLSSVVTCARETEIIFPAFPTSFFRTPRARKRHLATTGGDREHAGCVHPADKGQMK